MAWHTRSLITECSRWGCKRLATVRLYNSCNTALGLYCARCGNAKAAIENKFERKERRRERLEEASHV